MDFGPVNLTNGSKILAYLLGIRLQPRIRNWKGLQFYRPSRESRYQHIDSIFTGQIDWSLIETMLPEMLRVAVSVSAGPIEPSTILPRLATYSRKNKLYFALRELGPVVRTAVLFEYLSDIELRHTIQNATNKSERFNQFLQWVAFGGVLWRPKASGTNSGSLSSTTIWWRICSFTTTWSR